MGKKNAGAENISHVYYTVQSRDRYQALKRLVDFNPDIFGIFLPYQIGVAQEIAEKLIKDGYNADALHGDLSQQQRDKVMGPIPPAFHAAAYCHRCRRIDLSDDARDQLRAS